MKNLKLISLSLCFISLFTIAQISSKSFLISTTCDYTKIKGFLTNNCFDITFEKMIGNHIGLETSITRGKIILTQVPLPSVLRLQPCIFF